jgi:hypothetical protein
VHNHSHNPYSPQSAFGRPNDLMLRLKAVRTSLRNIASRKDAEAIRDEIEVAHNIVATALEKLERRAEDVA